MKGEKFPSSQDHPLPLYERYVDYCDSGALRRSVRSSQNVAMIFFRIHNAGSSFTLTVRKHINPFREYDSLMCASVVTSAGSVPLNFLLFLKSLHLFCILSTAALVSVSLTTKFWQKRSSLLISLRSVVVVNSETKFIKLLFENPSLDSGVTSLPPLSPPCSL